MEDEKPTIADQREFTTGNGHPEISQQSSSITGDESRPMDSQKGNDADHGNRFQSKLLLLFFLRAINKGYDFYLGTELPDQGAKFDDLIFKYHKQRNEGSDTSSWSYQYLQAKHKKYETESTKIKENQLLADAGDFSVPKYFRSFLEMSRRGDDIENCIVCTNADVDQNLVAAVQGDVTPEMLVFDEFVKETGGKPTCYQLKDTTKLRDKLKGHSIAHVLAEKLLDCVTNNKPLNAEDEKFHNYHMALIREKVINLDEGNFHQDFICQVQLSEGAKELRKALKNLKTKQPWDTWIFKKHSDKEKDTFGKIAVDPKEFNYKLPVAVEDKEISDFFDKFIFAANTLNENELTGILKKEVGEHFNLLDTDFQSAYISNEMVDWFKRKDNKWLSAEEGEKLFLRKVQEKMDCLRATAVSIDYQKQLSKLLQFNDKAIDEMAIKLSEMLASSAQKMVRLSTLSPNLTAIKAIAALGTERLKEYNKEDSYLVVPFKRLQDIKEQVKKLLDQKDSNFHLLVIVCGDEGDSVDSDQLESLVKMDGKEKEEGKTRKWIIIGGNEGAIHQDDLSFSDLSETSQNYLLDKRVSFQGEDVRVRDLVSIINEESNLMDSFSINDLLRAESKIIIPSFDTDTLRFKKSFYIQRRMTFPRQFDNNFWGEVVGCFNERRKIEKEKIRDTSENETNCKTAERKEKGKGTNERLEKEEEPSGWLEDETDDVADEVKEKEEISRNKNKQAKEELCAWLENEIDEVADEVKKKEEINRNKIKQVDASIDWLKYCITIHSNGTIQWLIDDQQVRKEIWEAMTKVLKERNCKEAERITEAQLFNEYIAGRRAIIISGVAGSGKSFMLSQFYDEIKKMREWKTEWVIKINFLEHSNVLLNFDPTCITAIDYLVNLPTLVNQKSPFSRWLLKHRLETGDHIVLMLDGFDEISRTCQAKAIQLMKGIIETESIRLYVTTRTHVANDLQFQLSQLAYTLDNFDFEKQTKCLTFFWENSLKVTENVPLEKFARSLVDQVSKDLKDEERAFIGIPLQCRILAECFNSKVQEIANQKNITVEDKEIQLRRILHGQSFDLAKLYELLMKTKRRVFREQKIKILLRSDKSDQETDDDITECLVNMAITKMELHLTKLAVETIFPDKEYVDILWSSNRYQSEQDLEEENRLLIDLCTRYGLTEVSSEGNVTFLHRTYAEYLAAKYLHGGFHPNDKKNNKLLNNEAGCALIVNKILVEDEYDGVQTFLDSLFKESIFLSSAVQQKFIVDPSGFHTAATKGKVNIFKHFCDCLDTTSPKEHVCHSVIEPLFQYFYQKSIHLGVLKSQIFQRCLDYYDYQTKDKLKKYLEKNSPSFDDLESLSHWNHEEAKINVKLLFQFITHHQGRSQLLPRQTVYSSTKFWKDMLEFFILNKEYDESYLLDFSKILSSEFKGNEEFAELLKDVIHRIRIRLTSMKDVKTVDKTSRIQKVLETLRELKRNKVLKELSRVVFILEPHIFEAIYKLRSTEEEITEIGMTTDMASLLCVPPSLSSHHCTIVGLYRAATSGKADTVEKTLRGFMKNNTPEETEVIKNILQEGINGLTPFYVAAVYGHENICNTIINVINQESRWKTYLWENNGFVHGALRNALISYNPEIMCEMILKVVKNVLGYEFLHFAPNLLQSKYDESLERKKVEQFKALVVDVAINRQDIKTDNPNYCTFNENILQNDLNYFEFIKAETLYRLLSVKPGFEHWIIQIIERNKDGHKGFVYLLKHFIYKFNEEQRSEFVQIITEQHTRKNAESSYWNDMFGIYFEKYENIPDEIHFKQIYDHLGESVLEKLLLHDEGGNGSIIERALLTGHLHFVNSVIQLFSIKKKSEIWRFLGRNVAGKTIVTRKRETNK